VRLGKPFQLLHTFPQAIAMQQASIRKGCGALRGYSQGCVRGNQCFLETIHMSMMRGILPLSQVDRAPEAFPERVAQHDRARTNRRTSRGIPASRRCVA
jgi:hypothetical protein